MGGSPARSTAYSITATLFTLVLLLGPGAKKAEAVAQWARKYGVSCTHCHTAFPRVNPVGEDFLLNGYQWPDAGVEASATSKNAPDGRTAVTDLTNLLGVRFSFAAAQWEEKQLNLGGTAADRWTIGSPNFMQLFVAGALYQDVSVFTELEFSKSAAMASNKTRLNTMHLGFHNLLGTPAVNFHIGNVSPLEFSSHSNKLRIMTDTRNSVMEDIYTSNDTGDDDVNTGAARPGVQYYGYRGPAVWWVGVSPGASNPDVNDQIHFWGGVKLQLRDETSSIYGSSVSLWGMQGGAARAVASTTSTASTYYTSRFQRVQVAGNLRCSSLDVQLSWMQGKDEDWDLTTAAKDGAGFDGVALMGGWRKDNWYPAVTYNSTNFTGAAAVNDRVHNVIPSITYLPMENLRVSLYITLDMNTDAGHTRSNGLLFNFHLMF